MFAYKYKYINGIFLIELLIALAISLLIFSLLFSIFITNQKSYSLYEVLNKMQITAQSTLDILQDQIHAAGYMGCAKLTPEFKIIGYESYTLTSQNKLIGDDHIINLSHAAAQNALLLEAMSSDNEMKTDTNTRYHVGDVLLISNCLQAEIFKVKKIINEKLQQKIITQSPLHYRYAPYAEIAKLERNEYFVAKTTRKHADGSTVYALFKRDIFQEKNEIIEDVSGMSILYLQIKDGKINALPAREIIDWSQVIGADIQFEFNVNSLKKYRYLYAYMGSHDKK